MIRLETSRLILRPLGEADLDAYAAMCADAETMRYIGDGRTMTRHEAWRSIAFILGHWQLRGFGLWGVEEKSTGRLVGRVGLHQPEGWPGLEVGYLIARTHWGLGYAPEAARAAMRHAFETLRADHVVSVIHPLNASSIRVAQKLGMHLERTDVLLGIDVLIYGRSR